MWGIWSAQHGCFRSEVLPAILGHGQVKWQMAVHITQPASPTEQSYEREMLLRVAITLAIAARPIYLQRKYRSDRARRDLSAQTLTASLSALLRMRLSRAPASPISLSWISVVSK